MAKPKNTLETATIKVSGNLLMEYYLERATETGFYGNNPTETAGILLGQALQELVTEAVIDKAPPEIIEAAKKKEPA